MITIDEIPSKTNQKAVTDTLHQLSADEVNAIVSQAKANREAIASIPVSSGTGGNSIIQTGAGNSASGEASSALGSNNTASGRGSHAEGVATIASGGCSHAEGWRTEAKNECEHACGRYNSSTESSDKSQMTMFSVGIGGGLQSDGTYDRRNALEAKRNGDLYMWLNGRYVKLQDVISALQSSYYVESSGKATLKAPQVSVEATGSGQELAMKGYKVVIEAGMDDIILKPGSVSKVKIGDKQVATVDMLESINERLHALDGK